MTNSSFPFTLNHNFSTLKKKNIEYSQNVSFFKWSGMHMTTFIKSLLRKSIAWSVNSLSLDCTHTHTHNYTIRAEETITSRISEDFISWVEVQVKPGEPLSYSPGHEIRKSKSGTMQGGAGSNLSTHTHTHKWKGRPAGSDDLWVTSAFRRRPMCHRPLCGCQLRWNEI